MPVINIKDESFRELIITTSAINDAPKITLDMHPIRLTSQTDFMPEVERVFGNEPFKTKSVVSKGGNKRKRNPNRWK